MRMFARLLTAVALLASGLISQSLDVPAAFIATDVHESAPQRNEYARGPYLRGPRFEVRDANMVDLVAAAYDVKPDLVVGGPNWVEMDRFDVVAKASEKLTPAKARELLQALLAQRFGLKARKDTQEIEAFALTAGKHAGLKKSGGEGEAGCKFQPMPPAAADSGPRTPTFGYACKNMTMAAFARALKEDMPTFRYLREKTVIDQTGLDGAYDFNFHFSLMAGGADSDSVTLADAVEKQLGLKLAPGKTPTAVIVIDQVNRKPTTNAPGVVEALDDGPAPTEFEVADVKLSGPEGRNMNFDILPGGQVDIRGLPMQFIFQQAFNLPPFAISGQPDWFNRDRFDIIAKAPVSALQLGPDGKPRIDDEMLQVMLQALLRERFQLKTHMENRVMDAFTLIAVKPKMKQADPNSRTHFTEGPASMTGKDPRDTNPALSRLVTCTNLTMAQFAKQLQRIAPGYIHSPVVDATHLEGGWDFTLSFSPAGATRGGGRGGLVAASRASAGGEGGTQASDPSGAVTLLEAIEKQIGLKLVTEKRPVSMLVIDHIEEKPIEN
ncbi:MAG TPA: TIGR03435 family protein [Bryobacteraceae bacterium]|nr:TIGR03435 family protein [Bryobacteraceae bacterium]